MNIKREIDTTSITQLLRHFSTEEKCIEWLESIRWNGKPVCPHCGEADKIGSPPPSKPHHHWCRPCRKHFTVKTKSIFHSSKTTLQNWVVAIYSVLTRRKGVSAVQLSKELGVQYNTAWYMLHRIREACDGGDFTLSGIVEADETHIGGEEGNKHAHNKLRMDRGTVGKVAVAREQGESNEVMVIA